MNQDLARETITDLLRSGWIVFAGRHLVYERWSGADRRFAAPAQRAEEAAGIIARALEGRHRRQQGDLAEAHARWIADVAGAAPGEVPFGDIFVVRLGDWAEAHAGPYLDEGRDRLQEICGLDRASVRMPAETPAPPEFRRLEAPDIRAPGEVLFRFGILGDLHFGSPRGEAAARAAIADLNRSGAELVIQLGDITDHGDPDEFELAVKVLGELEVPCTSMLGNHDVYSYKEERLSGRELYPNSFGRQPDGVLLEHRGFRFAVLDSAENATSPFAPFNLVTGRFAEGRGGATVRGSLTTPQHEILADLAAPGAPPAFVFLHHPVQPFTAFPPVLFGLRDADSGRLHAVCDSGNVWGAFAGHTHRNARTTNLGRVPAHEVAIPRDFPFGFALVDVTETGYAYRFVQLSDTELLRESWGTLSDIHIRYGLGTPDERAFVWKA